MNTNNPIVRKLAETLNARTEAALQALASLDAEILNTLAEAEESARERLHAASVQLDTNTTARLRSFQATLDEMAADVLARTTADLLYRVETLACGLYSVPPTVEVPEPEPADAAHACAVADLFIARSREYAAVAYAARQAAEKEQEANPEPAAEPDATREAERTAAITGDILAPLAVPTPETLPVAQDDPEYTPAVLPATTAAHAVEAQDVAMLPEGDEEDDQDDGIEDSALLPDDGISITHDLLGLCERRGAGRNVRYSPVDGLPVDGVIYYRKVGRKWEPVRFIQG